MNREETLKQLKSLIELSGIPVTGQWELANRYWPDSYHELVVNSPWLLVRTPAGMIQIGWRKRVISISWEDTSIRKEITSDDTTKSDTMVHAWTLPKALEYLTALSRLVKESQA